MEEPDNAEAPPMDYDMVLQVLATVDGRAVLVGGQAISWWATYYEERLQLADVTVAYTSQDIDLLSETKGKMDEVVARDLAKALKGQVKLISKRQWNSLLSRQVLFNDAGIDREVDVLKRMSGVEEEEVLATAVHFDASDGVPDVRVIDPIAMLEVRLYLADTLAEYRTPRALAQATVAAAVVHEWLIDKLDDSWSAARQPVESTLRVLTSATARRVKRKTGLDTRRALPPAAHQSYPEKFLTEQLPRALAKLP